MPMKRTIIIPITGVVFSITKKVIIPYGDTTNTSK